MLLLRRGGYKKRGRPRTAYVRRLTIVLCTLLTLVGITSVGCATDSTTGSASATSSSATRTPAATPKPAVAENAAVLGGAVYAFTKKLGNSGLGGYRNGWDSQGPYGVVWTGVWYDGYTYGAVDDQSKDRVTTINITGQDETPAYWTVSQADTICTPYLPPDARYKGTSAVKFTTGDVKGTEKRYTSALLANTLPASDFTDVNGHAVTPGTFYVYYSAQYNGSPTMLVGWCILSTDEQQAQEL